MLSSDRLYQRDRVYKPPGMNPAPSEAQQEASCQEGGQATLESLEDSDEAPGEDLTGYPDLGPMRYRMILLGISRRTITRIEELRPHVKPVSA